MTLLEFHADIEQLTFQVKRLADLFEEYLHPKPTAEEVSPTKKDWEVTTFKPRGRWEAEREDREWRKQSDEVAGIMPRK